VETNGGRRRTVLIADADDASVVTARDVLTSVGYRTLTTAQGDEALRIGLKERPAVALLEVELPRMNGFELCRAFRDELGQTIGIALVSATRTTPIDVSSGLLIGADDYIAKPVDPSELVGRVRALGRRVTMNGADGSSEGLTGREREILRLLAEGLDQAEIAGTLSVSPRTVGGHIEHVLVKLGVHSRAQAVAAAYRLRLFD
jgi:DNA-binding NarL/FixJ family response regulator